MDLDSEISRMKGVLKFLGYYPRRSKCNPKACVFYSAVIYLVINMAFYVEYNWSDVAARLNGAKYMANYSLIGLYLLIFTFKWNDMIKSFRVIESYPYDFPYHVTTIRRRLIMSTGYDMARLSNIWYRAIRVSMAFSIYSPLLSIFIAVLKKNIRDIDANELLLFFPFYYSQNRATLAMYVFGYCLQAIFIMAAGLYGYVATSAAFLSMQTIEGELKLLRLSIESIDEIIKGPDTRSSCAHNHELVLLRSFLNYFIQHHQCVYRKAADVNKGIQWFAFTGNFSVSLYVCLEISNFVKTEMTLLKMQQLFFCLLWVYNIYCYDYFGEKIVIEDDNLRTALYQCSWIEKRQWFKKSLQMIMIRASKPIQMKPAGLFQLNLKNFALCINAAYSYYNIINNVTSS